MATVPRSSILAYFHDPDEITVNGATLPVFDYHEHECILDPATMTGIVYERVEGCRQRQGLLQGAPI
jgi:hypothetical protein